MAEIQPLRALRYDLSVVGSLADVTAPPYDVIDPEQRAALLARSPHNIVAIDLPAGEGKPASDPYSAAAALLDSWQLQGALVRDREPAVWAHTQEYAGPGGRALTRHGVFCRVRIEQYGPGRVRPHERTHPGPKQDRLELTRATRTNISSIFSLYSDPAQAAWAALEPFTAGAPWGEVTDADNTTHRLWRVADAQAIAAVKDATRNAELLIADGHHRYETMQAYAEEVGGEGEHRYVLMYLVALQDPGLTVFPTHRLIGGLDEERRHALESAIARDFHSEEVSLDRIAPEIGDRGSAVGQQPPSATGPMQVGYIEHRDFRPRLLTLRDQAIADAALPGRSRAYRRLDTGVLEALLLKGALGLSDEDISHLNGLFYARSTEEALELVRAGAYDGAFFMRATPVAQVAELAAAGENMPPKSTFFFPKLLTGLLLSPLA
jgi:uncharacterized protein (DUF1015 family)